MNIKNEKGITLVALVVTIIVMIILASIAISASVGDNGLIKQTQEGVINASKREVEEAIEVKILLKEKEKIKNGDFTDVNISDLELFDEPETEKIDDITYNIYTITPEDLKELSIEGEYGNTKGVFKIKEHPDTHEYEVIYED